MLKIALFSYLLLAANTFAVPIDPTSNHIGIYFDTGATTTDITSSINVPFNAYVIITNPTSSAIWGLEVGYQVLVPPGFENAYTRLSSTLPPMAIDLGNSSDADQGDYIVGLAMPLPQADAVVFVSWQFVLTDDFPMDFFIQPATTQSYNDDLPACLDDSVMVVLIPSSGDINTAVATVNREVSDVPNGRQSRLVELEQCQPNPFNPRTTIWYSLAEEGRVDLIVHDLSGRVVATLLAGEFVGPGRHQVTWDGRDSEGHEVASGVYFYRIEALGAGETRRMTLVR